MCVCAVDGRLSVGVSGYLGDSGVHQACQCGEERRGRRRKVRCQSCDCF